jgi:hypothetical protein
LSDHAVTPRETFGNVAVQYRGCQPFNEHGTRRQSVFRQWHGDGYIAEAPRAA